MTYKLTIRHGDIDNPTVIEHESKTAHGWTYTGDGYWQFFEGREPGDGSWACIVSDLRSAVDRQTGEVAGQTGDGTVQDPVSGWTHDTGAIPPVPPWGTGRG